MKQISKNKYDFSLILLILAAVIFPLCLLPSPYDESLYRNFSAAMSLTGRPELADGYFLRVHPYLVISFQALWIKLGFSSLLSLRLLHFMVWVVPAVLLTWKISRVFFPRMNMGSTAAMFFLLGLGFFHFEAATAELDMPLVAFFLLGILCTWFWLEKVRDGETFGPAWCILMTVLFLAAWVKFQAQLIAFSVFCIALFELSATPKPLRKKLLMAALLGLGACTLGFVTWCVWVHFLGKDIIGFLGDVLFSLQGKNPVFQWEVTRYGWVRYLVFAAATINMPLFIAAGMGAMCMVREKELRRQFIYLGVPLAFILASVLMSGVREVRYLDAALPFLCLFASGIIGGLSVESHMGKWAAGFFFAVVPTLAALIFSHALPEVPLGQFRLDFFQFVAIGLTCGASAVFFLQDSPVRKLFCTGIIMGAVLGVGAKEIKTSYTENQTMFRESESVNAMVQEFCTSSTRIAGYRQSLGYGLQCPYFDMDGVKNPEISRLIKNDFWILPLSAANYPEAFREETFRQWLSQNYEIHPSSSRFRMHVIWSRKADKSLKESL